MFPGPIFTFVTVDVPGSVLDLVLELAYTGWVGGLGLNNISQVRDVCRILDMCQSDFVVRSEDKGFPNSAVSRVGDTSNSVVPRVQDTQPSRDQDAPRTSAPRVGEILNPVTGSSEESAGDETDSCFPVSAPDIVETRLRTQVS